MNRCEVCPRIAFVFALGVLAVFPALGDGGYFSRSVAVSADQRAIIIKSGDEISMTFSTGYTGEGDDFGWLIPVPVPPAVEDVEEAGEAGETFFQQLDGFSSPEVERPSGGCFPAGAQVLTADGPRAIETIAPGSEVCACDPDTGQWVLRKVLERHSHQYEGDMVAIELDSMEFHATGNHPFYVLRGESLASRPPPEDVPSEDRPMSGPGRWVEARDLQPGDLLKSKGGEASIITGVTSRREKTVVYNLNVRGCHNYAVHERGILVHNKGGEESPESQGQPLVTVYAKVALEHYEASILGAADASALLGWLRKNDYKVNSGALEVLDGYIDRRWAFVAVRLSPSEKRRYENEALPPLTIRFKHDRLIFPLRISSVSTTQTAKITLYVIAESTVSSSNFPTAALRHDEYLFRGVDPEKYIEACIERTAGGGNGRGLVVMWSGEIGRWVDTAVNALGKSPFAAGEKKYLTRIETRLAPTAMTEDVELRCESIPKGFQVSFRSGKGDDSGVPPEVVVLIAAAQIGDEEEVTAGLNGGTDANAANDFGATPLMAAAGSGHIDVAKILLEAGARVYPKDRLGRTALMKAALYGDTGIVEVLLDAGASVQVKDDDGRNVLINTAFLGGDVEVIRLLLRAGSNPNARDGLGMTALYWAAVHGRAEAVQVLREAGARLNAKDRSSGYEALRRAADGGYVRIIRALLEAGVEPSEGDPDETALIAASRGGHAEIVRLLLQAGSDVNHRNSDGESALMAARGRKHTAVIDLLIEAGAEE